MKNRRLSDQKINENYKNGTVKTNDKSVHCLNESYFDTHGYNQIVSLIKTYSLFLLIIILTSNILFSIHTFGYIYTPINIINQIIPNQLFVKLISIYIIVVLFVIEVVYLLEKHFPLEKFEIALIFCILLGIPIFHSYYVEFKDKNLWLDPTAICVMIFLKIFSYIQYNSDMETQSDEKYKRKSLSRRNLYYFIISPTLCYEDPFPRTKAIRINFIIQKLIILFIFGNISILFARQLIYPTIAICLKALKVFNYILFLSEFMKLCCYNLLLWLFLFIIFFECFLNILAEILKFGDRCFYREWWNCSNIFEFWRAWNVPVYRWNKTYIYMPLIKRGYSRAVSCTAVYIISGIMHEFVASSIFHLWNPWMFLMMVFQIPLNLIIKPSSTKYMPIVFFFLTLLNHGLIALLYCQNYYKTSGKMPFFKIYNQLRNIDQIYFVNQTS